MGETVWEAVKICEKFSDAEDNASQGMSSID